MRLGLALAFALLSAAASVTPAAECPGADPSAPRTLILALDGVPYRAMRTAREMGAFSGWGPTRPLVSTFPSMTNVGFAAILRPFGTDRVPGYELRRYDPETNAVTGGGLGDFKFAWRKQFDLQQTGFWAKVGLYMTPRSKTQKGIKRVGEFVLESSDEIVLALVSSTDNLTHVCGEAALVRALLRISDEIETTRRIHRRVTGRGLDVVMLSDHGNADHKVKRSDGFKALMRAAGLRPAKRLEKPNDVVPVTYGLVGYGVLYLAPDRAETAARAVLGLRGVNVAAWRSAPHTLRVLSPSGEAIVEWRDGGSERRFAYRPVSGDPLDLLAAQGRMATTGLLDDQGFGRRADWFDATAFEPYPDSLTRLVDSLAGVWVSNAATVIFSFEPGHAWGSKSVEVGAWLRGGKLEQTHGSLDRESTWGFFMTSDPARGTPRALRADRALDPWASRSQCTTAVRIDVGRGPHSPRILH